MSERNEAGQFVKGVSGNPLGRPKNAKNEITNLKQNLELAVRKNVSAHDIHDIVHAMVEKAKEGSVQAAKLILDKTISNAKEAEDITEASNGIQVIVKNATVSMASPERDITPETPIIDGELDEQHSEEG